MLIKYSGKYVEIYFNMKITCPSAFCNIFEDKRFLGKMTMDGGMELSPEIHAGKTGM